MGHMVESCHIPRFSIVELFLQKELLAYLGSQAQIIGGVQLYDHNSFAVMKTQTIYLRLK